MAISRVMNHDFKRTAVTVRQSVPAKSGVDVDCRTYSENYTHKLSLSLSEAKILMWALQREIKKCEAVEPPKAEEPDIA